MNYLKMNARNYDDWKTTDPADAELGPELYDCDCCGKPRECSRTWVQGIETFACDECLGIEPDDDSDAERERIRDDKMWDEQNFNGRDDDDLHWETETGGK